jgi:hypothetical protein
MKQLSQAHCRNIKMMVFIKKKQAYLNEEAVCCNVTQKFFPNKYAWYFKNYS